MDNSSKISLLKKNKYRFHSESVVLISEFFASCNPGKSASSRDFLNVSFLLDYLLDLPIDSTLLKNTPNSIDTLDLLQSYLIALEANTVGIHNMFDFSLALGAIELFLLEEDHKSPNLEVSADYLKLVLNILEKQLVGNPAPKKVFPVSVQKLFQPSLKLLFKLDFILFSSVSDKLLQSLKDQTKNILQVSLFHNDHLVEYSMALQQMLLPKNLNLVDQSNEAKKDFISYPKQFFDILVSLCENENSQVKIYAISSIPILYDLFLKSRQKHFPNNHTLISSTWSVDFAFFQYLYLRLLEKNISEKSTETQKIWMKVLTELLFSLRERNVYQNTNDVVAQEQRKLLIKLSDQLMGLQCSGSCLAAVLRLDSVLEKEILFFETLWKIAAEAHWLDELYSAVLRNFDTLADVIFSANLNSKVKESIKIALPNQSLNVLTQLVEFMQVALVSKRQKHLENSQNNQISKNASSFVFDHVKILVETLHPSTPTQHIRFSNLVKLAAEAVVPYLRTVFENIELKDKKRHRVVIDNQSGLLELVISMARVSEHFNDLLTCNEIGVWIVNSKDMEVMMIEFSLIHLEVMMKSSKDVTDEMSALLKIIIDEFEKFFTSQRDFKIISRIWEAIAKRMVLISKIGSENEIATLVKILVESISDTTNPCYIVSLKLLSTPEFFEIAPIKANVNSHTVLSKIIKTLAGGIGELQIQTAVTETLKLISNDEGDIMSVKNSKNVVEKTCSLLNHLSNIPIQYFSGMQCEALAVIACAIDIVSCNLGLQNCTDITRKMMICVWSERKERMTTVANSHSRELLTRHSKSLPLCRGSLNTSKEYLTEIINFLTNIVTTWDQYLNEKIKNFRYENVKILSLFQKAFLATSGFEYPEISKLSEFTVKIVVAELRNQTIQQEVVELVEDIFIWIERSGPGMTNFQILLIFQIPFKEIFMGVTIQLVEYLTLLLTKNDLSKTEKKICCELTSLLLKSRLVVSITPTEKETDWVVLYWKVWCLMDTGL
ncbi:hypothetical protein HK096_002699 [Nowakowskiella sp. JEL0078]|nr:hypothetical protein HK096_002699 [Nowakowskiella sp. JEL0078]